MKNYALHLLRIADPSQVVFHLDVLVRANSAIESRYENGVRWVVLEMDLTRDEASALLGAIRSESPARRDWSTRVIIECGDRRIQLHATGAVSYGWHGRRRLAKFVVTLNGFLATGGPDCDGVWAPPGNVVAVWQARIIGGGV